MAQVLVLMSSPRKNGNTDRLADAFIKGVEENGYSTEKVYVNYQNIKPCLGCNVCQKTKECIQKDDMQEIYSKMLEAKIIVFASTGSEMDKSCVIANVEKGVKSGINGDILRPRASFLDPTNTFSVSPKQTACGGFDIMAHLFDMNYFVNSDKYPLQFNVVETLLRTIRQQLPIAVEEPENYSARATMLWAASWALNSFCTSGYKTQAQLHALEQFSSTYDMTHGLALAIITPKWMTYLLNKDETVARDFARFGLNVMGIQDQGDDMANAKAGIEALQNFIKDELHLPTTLSEMNITDEKFDELKVKACYGQDSLPRAYRPLSQEDCLNIYKMCL